MGFQAVCIGYMICKKYGVDTQNFAINRIPEGLASKEPKEIRESVSEAKTLDFLDMSYDLIDSGK